MDIDILGSFSGSLMSDSITERKVDVDHGDNLDRVAVEQCGLINPFLHRFSGGIRKDGFTAHELEFLDGAISGDGRLKLHFALNTLFLGLGRIYGTRLPEQL